jgi:Flp pilus assembly protein TadG
MMHRRNNRLLLVDSGSVTAEFALALPSMALVIAVTLSGFGLQVERMKLVSVAASAARALGRGEGQAAVQTLVSESAPEASLSIEVLENHVCAKLTRSFMLAGLQSIAVDERQCARKMGL